MGQNKDVFISSAEYGVPFGGMLTAASASLLFADKVSLLMLVVIFVALIAPVVIYYLQRKRYVRSNGFATYSELWVLGIFTTMCGAFICGLVTYGLITCLRPDVVFEQLQMLSTAYKQMPQPEAKEMAEVVDKAIAANMIPSPIDFCLQMFWLTASLGCVGGALTAFIASKVPLKKDNE